MNTRFSIIVPVYNTTIELLDRCLKSIEKCEMDNYEIIIVNDGSNGDITEKIERFVKNRKKIKYFFKENGGVSSARDVGIRNSSGEYVVFVDADDTVFDLYLASADKLIKKYSPDLIIGKRVFEKIENGKLSAAKVTFGAEPKDYEVQEFINRHYYHLKFSPAIKTDVKDIKKNPGFSPFSNAKNSSFSPWDKNIIPPNGY